MAAATSRGVGQLSVGVEPAVLQSYRAQDPELVATHEARARDIAQ